MLGKSKIASSFLLAIGLFSIANAGLNGLTHHSRANCGNNESISWDWLANHLLSVDSQHWRKGVIVHIVSTDFSNTWRSAAVHWGEGTGGWAVVGHHWTISGGKYVLLQQETVTDCSIYNGWWDYNK